MNIQDVLKNVDILADLTKDELDQLVKLARVREFSENTEIFHEGDPGSELFILLEGRVVIEIHLKLQSEKAAVHTVGEGQVFGEVALADGGARSATATAVKRSKLLSIARQDLESLIEKDPRIGYVIMRNFSRTLCSRIRKSTKELRASLMFD